MPRQIALNGTDLGVDGIVDAGPVVDLDDDADPGCLTRHHLHGLAYGIHYRTPLPLDVGEHCIGLNRKSTLAKHCDGLCDLRTHGFAKAEGSYRNGSYHTTSIARSALGCQHRFSPSRSARA